jgi:hypothetical protein
MNPRERQHRASLFDDPFREPLRLRRRGADHQQEASRRVAKTI